MPQETPADPVGDTAPTRVTQPAATTLGGRHRRSGRAQSARSQSARADDASATGDFGPVSESRFAAADTRLPFGLITAAIIIAALYFGREILMPLALSILIGFVLEPLVARLRRLGVPRAAGAAIVVLTSLGILAALAFFVGTQMRTIAMELPYYQYNITSKAQGLLETINSPGALDDASRVLSRVQQEIEAKQREMAESAERAAGEAADKSTMRVEVIPASESPLARLTDFAERFSGPAATFAIVLLFVVLILLDRGDLRDRAVRLLGGSLHRTTDALDEAAHRISRYLTMQLVVNVSYGIPMALGLWLIGVPGAILWGLLAAVLRFVPYAGPVLSAIPPLVLAFAVDPGWTMLLWAAGLILLLELVSNNVIEPWLYGTSTGLSVISLLLSAAFWTALWGPIGLVLSTPLTVCLLVLGRHLPQLQFLDVLLGSERALDAPTRFYQRLLAGDVEECVELALDYREEKDTQSFYDEVAIPVLRVASEDHSTVATAEHRLRVVTGIDAVIDELSERDPATSGAGAYQVVCVGGRWELDALAAEMAAHALAIEGFRTEHAPAAPVVSADYIERLGLQGADLVCLSYFSPEPLVHARHFVMRIRRRWPKLPIVVALWNVPAEQITPATIERVRANAIACSMHELVARVQAIVEGHPEEAWTPPELAEPDAARLRTLAYCPALREHLQEHFDTAAQRAADVFDVLHARVVLIDPGFRINGADEEAPAEQSSEPKPQPVDETAATLNVGGADTLVVPDVLRDPRFASNPALREHAVRFYASAPLVDSDGFVLGALCLFDDAPRHFEEGEVKLLAAMADDLIRALRAEAGLEKEEPLTAPADQQGAKRDGEAPSTAKRKDGREAVIRDAQHRAEASEAGTFAQTLDASSETAQQAARSAAGHAARSSEAASEAAEAASEAADAASNAAEAASNAAGAASEAAEAVENAVASTEQADEPAARKPQDSASAN